MTSDPAYDWDCYDAMIRMSNALFAATHSCNECPYHRPSPEGKYGWCTQWEDFADGELGMAECDYWND